MNKIPKYRDTPEEAIYAIRRMLDGRIVCDVGCGHGHLMDIFSKYAGKVVGIERDEKEYAMSKESGYDIILGDATIDELPKADIYYVCVSYGEIEGIINNIKEGTIVIGGIILPERLSTLEKLWDMGGFTIEIPCIGYLQQKIDFNLTIINKKESTINE